jgi:hypothetical protein
LDKIAANYEIALEDNLPEDKIDTLVERLAKINKVVLLIDEYDHPILKHLNNIRIAEANRDILKSFYEGIKSLDAYLHAVFITGVSKFSKTSIFSGINNLIDISLTPTGATLLGYTPEEIDTYFDPYMRTFAEQNQITKATIKQEMQDWYNGYRFSEKESKVYNPFSVLNYLKEQKKANYWAESGTPAFLISPLQKQFESLEDIQTIELGAESLGTFEIDNIPLIALLFQAGYLTIADYDARTNKFKLGYPNAEVEESLKRYLVAALTRTNTLTVERSTSLLINALETNDIPAFCRALQTLFAHIPYHLHMEEERYYHSLFQFLGALLDIPMFSQTPTDKGRIDLVIEVKKYLYILELKFHASAAAALEQIEDRKYYERYLNKGKKIILVGISFGHAKKRLTLEYATRSLENCQSRFHVL